MKKKEEHKVEHKEERHAIVTEFSEEDWDKVVELSTFYGIMPARVIHNIVHTFMEAGFPRTMAGMNKALRKN